MVLLSRRSYRMTSCLLLTRIVLQAILLQNTTDWMGIPLIQLGPRGVVASTPVLTTATQYLSKGDELLSMQQEEEAINYYQKAIQLLQRHGDDDRSDDKNEVSGTFSSRWLTFMSLYTNLGTAYSTQGRNDAAADAYQNALLVYQEGMATNEYDTKTLEDATAIAVETSFFLGMVYQDLGQARDAVEAYRYTQTLDPNHWASCANEASVFHDMLSNHDRALAAYNRAYTILTDPKVTPTDPPPEPRSILSQIQYRIGLCLSAREDRKCVVLHDVATDDAATAGEGVKNEMDSLIDGMPASCYELAAHAFDLAVHYDPDNAAAKHMLATLTADATMKRADNKYIRSLFDDYASNFEQSLVKDLQYTGYERLRRGFDRAMEVHGISPLMFQLVVDAGCGTGLAGEQFRNVTRTLVGVDLSAAIIDQAQTKRPGLYDIVRVGDVMDIFSEYAGQISLIIAADSFIYFGDLLPLMEAMGQGVQQDGFAAFTLENVSLESEESLDNTKQDWRWQLTARYAIQHKSISKTRSSS